MLRCNTKVLKPVSSGQTVSSSESSNHHKFHHFRDDEASSLMPDPPQNVREEVRISLGVSKIPRLTSIRWQLNSLTCQACHSQVSWFTHKQHSNNVQSCSSDVVCMPASSDVLTFIEISGCRHMRFHGISLERGRFSLFIFQAGKANRSESGNLYTQMLAVKSD